MRTPFPAVVVAACLSVTAPALAQSSLPPTDYANRQLADPAKEAEAKALMETLRCLVCQGQSIADSDADMAGDMRALVRRRIAAGEEPEAIRDVAQSYGVVALPAADGSIDHTTSSTTEHRSLPCRSSTSPSPSTTPSVCFAPTPACW